MLEYNKHFKTASWKGEDLVYDELSEGRHIFFDVKKKFVIKVDHFPTKKWDTYQTKTEIEFWLNLAQKDKKHFAKILDYGKTSEGKIWLRQKFYSQTEKDELKIEHIPKLKELRDKYSIKDLSHNITNSEGNWLIHRGEVLIYDWGGVA